MIEWLITALLVGWLLLGVLVIAGVVLGLGLIVRYVLDLSRELSAVQSSKRNMKR